jgi:adenylate cyclase
VAFWKKLFSPTPPAPCAEETAITALFASIEGYMALAEQVPLPKLGELMNEYFALSAEVIEAEQGNLDKFVGDVAVTWFGPPRKRTDHAFRACVAALRFQERMLRLREKNTQEGEKWPEIARHIHGRVGIHTGEAIVGTIVRGHHTALGDNVNLAARLEKGAKNYGAQIICTADTKAECERSSPGAILFRSLGKIVVKGRMESVYLYEPMAFSKQATPRLRECITIFEQGLAKCRESKWDEAGALFQQSAKLEPNAMDRRTNPSVAFNVMLQQARQCQPPAVFMP